MHFVFFCYNWFCCKLWPRWQSSEAHYPHSMRGTRCVHSAVHMHRILWQARTWEAYVSHFVIGICWCIYILNIIDISLFFIIKIVICVNNLHNIVFILFTYFIYLILIIIKWLMLIISYRKKEIWKIPGI